MKFLLASIFFLAICLKPYGTPTSINAGEERASDVLALLDAKCNVCHRNENPKAVFTESNLSDFVKKIDRQVFFWKRMPKGNKIKLTESESDLLKNWIKSSLK